MSDAKPSRGKRGGRGAGPNGCSDGAADATTAPKRVSGKRGAGKKEAVTSPGRGKKAKKGIEEGLTGLVYSDSVQAMEGWVQESGGGDGHGPETLDGDAPFMDTVVKVFATHCSPNFSLPWSRKRQYTSTSTGFAIGGKRLLTNAHSVECHTQVKVKRRGSDLKFVAKVVAIGVECDLALLLVEDDAFWEGQSYVRFGVLPRLQDSVLVVGYPIGGDTVSVTSGVVSRIEVTAYVHGSAELLGVQIDAAINSGNSGGPVFNDLDECVGVAFQSMKQDDAENIGYIIPTPVIHHFIADYERNGAYTGFPTLGVEWQKLENPHLRKSLGMKDGAKGVLLCQIEPTAPAHAALQKEDILVSFDGVAIANDGTVPFRQGERIGFSYLVSKRFSGETAVVELLQNGKSRTLEVKLNTPKRLVPVHTGEQLPSYFIVAGLVFTLVSVPYLRSEYGKQYEYDAPVKLLDKMMYGKVRKEAAEIVVLAQVLAAEVNIGYEDIVNAQVIAFNKTPISTLAELAELVTASKDKYLRFDLEYNHTVVLERKEAMATTKDILATHCIPSATSADLIAPDKSK